MLAVNLGCKSHRAPRRIYSVDDCADNLALVKAVVEELSAYEVLSFASGFSVIEAIQSEPPSLLLLDLMMPGMNGYEVTRMIRGDSRLLHFPIILLTSWGEEERKNAERIGVDDFLPKPFCIYELMERIQHQLDKTD